MKFEEIKIPKKMPETIIGQTPELQEFLASLRRQLNHILNRFNEANDDRLNIFVRASYGFLTELNSQAIIGFTSQLGQEILFFERRISVPEPSRKWLVVLFRFAGRTPVAVFSDEFQKKPDGTIPAKKIFQKIEEILEEQEKVTLQPNHQ